MAKRKPVKRVVDKTVGNRISDLHHRMDNIHSAVAQDISDLLRLVDGMDEKIAEQAAALSKRLDDLTTRFKAGEKRAEPIDWMQERVTKLAEHGKKTFFLPQQVAELHEDAEGLKQAISELTTQVNRNRGLALNDVAAVNERLDGVDEKIAALGCQIGTPEQRHNLVDSMDACNAKRAELEDKVSRLDAAFGDRVTELERKMRILADSLGIIPAPTPAEESAPRARAMGHTPGPWSCHPWGDNDYEINSNGTTICSVPGFHDDTVEEGRSEDNARLIAAAPELLEALEVMIASFAGAMELDENDVDADGYDYDAMKQARAVIAKAKGGQP